MKNEALLSRYSKLLNNWTENESFVSESWTGLKREYTLPNRKYHSFTHLEDMFHSFDEFKNELVHPNEISFAIFYHDLVYKCWSNKNELNSAAAAKADLEIMNVDKNSIQRIYDLIMVTKNHRAYENPDEKWMVDFDLKVLGSDWETYQKYAQNIRKECSFFPDFIYRKRRKRALNRFLGRSTIYQTEIFREKYESQARINIEKEIDQL